MLSPGDVVGGRFEVTDADRSRGVDRETGEPVRFPEPPPEYVFDVFAMRAQARAARALGDPRLARIHSVDPVVVEAPPESGSSRLEHRHIVDATIELVE